MMKIYVGIRASSHERELLQSEADGAEIVFADGATDSAARREFLECEVALGLLPADWIAASRELRWLQLGSVGFDDLLHLDWSILGNRIRVTNLHGMFAEPVAETILGGVLALYRRLDQLILLARERDWQKSSIRRSARNLAGARVLIGGAGTIAKRLEQLLKPFRCEVFSLSRSSGSTGVARFDEFLPSADVVCLTMPETAETRGFFDARRIAAMKPSGIFVNVGRGGLVDESALIDALRLGRIAGAVIDVTCVEPLPRDHPMWDVPNTILTQHTSAGSVDEDLQKVQLFLENLRRYRRREPLLNVVDFVRGY